MLEKKKIERLERRNKALQEDNLQLNKQIKELQQQIEANAERVEAANHYAEEHALVLRTAAEARERYDLAYKQMMMLKKEYEKRMERVLKDFE